MQFFSRFVNYYSIFILSENPIFDIQRGNIFYVEYKI